ncbi:MAG: hypothetical protein Q7S64_00185 [bacterium]|nr:hypothetical protein [bacterium]
MMRLVRGAVLGTILLLLLELVIVVLWPQTLTTVADLVVRIRSLIALN